MSTRRVTPFFKNGFLHVYSPEGLGVVSGAIFLVASFLFIPIPFLDYSELQVLYLYLHM